MSDDMNQETLTVGDNVRPTAGWSVEEIARDPQAASVAFNQFFESTRSSISDLQEKQRELSTALTDAQAKLSDLTAIGALALAAKTQIVDAQTVIAAKSEHIQNAQVHADAVRANLDRTFTGVAQRATEAGAEADKVKTSATEVTTCLTEVQRLRAVADAENVAAEKARKAAEASAEVTKNLADKAATIEERVASYEKRLSELDAQCAKQLETITKLLPGATSAGLAHAFDERRQTFLKPQGGWQKVFVGSIITIVVIAVTGLWQVYHAGQAPSYDELVRLWLARLPVAGALVWLALHASREVALAKRLEEDYGYKSATASCFEGFQKQMAEVEQTAVPGSPLATLCQNTLQTIASPPGRIYDKHKLIVTPADGMKDAAKVMADAATAVRPQG